MQGNAQAGVYANQGIYQNYMNARTDLYGMGGAGYYGGSPYAAGNIGGQFGISGGIYAGFGF